MSTTPANLQGDGELAADTVKRKTKSVRFELAVEMSGGTAKCRQCWPGSRVGKFYSNFFSVFRNKKIRFSTQPCVNILCFITSLPALCKTGFNRVGMEAEAWFNSLFVSVQDNKHHEEGLTSQTHPQFHNDFCCTISYHTKGCVAKGACLWGW